MNGTIYRKSDLDFGQLEIWLPLSGQEKTGKEEIFLVPKVKVCSFCQTDLSSGNNSFLAPVGDTEQFKDFCSQNCLEQYEMKVCSFCQTDLSSGINSILAPVGDTEQFKDFCSQNCIDKYEIMNNISKNTPQAQVGSQCKEQGTFEIQVEPKEIVLDAEIVPETFPQHSLGCLLFAKIGNYPYWPCMVSYDPKTGTFFKRVSLKGRKSSITEIYHVQYFGKIASHGWTTSNILHFDGAEKYFALRDECVNAAATDSQKKKMKMKYHVPPSILQDWLYAVNEGEKAMRCRIEDRYELYVFRYDLNFKSTEKDKKKNKKRRKHRITKKKQPKPIVTLPSSIVEPLCDFCEKGSVDLFCSSGICKKAFHKECLGMVHAPADFQCVYCATDKKQPCIICKSVGSQTQKCVKCNVFYHDFCLKSFKNADLKRNICSAHVCWSCFVRNPRNGASKGSFVTCFRCPTAYHDTQNCLPVGCVRLSPDVILCPQHFLGKNKISPQSVNNVNFCQTCFEGGELICCESCPNAYHKACIHGETPLGDFYCDDCTLKKDLYSGMIVWAKSGNFRWWPAQILNADDVPPNIKALVRYDGEFPVLFFGSDEYSWTHRGRVFPYNEMNRHLRISCSKSNKELWFKFLISLEEAAEAYEEYQQKFLNAGTKPAPYRHIRVNRAVPPAVIVNKPHSSCACSASDENPCGPESMCLNRTMLYECHADICTAKEKCQNQRFQKREYAAVKVFKTPNCGYGLQARQFIREGSFIIEYVGEVITTVEYERRANQMRINNSQNYYFLYLDHRRIIDAGPSGNQSRFINHSCHPNCVMEKWSVNGDLRIGIFALHDIQQGDELTFNYQSEVEFGQQCNCGAIDCLGVIGRNGKKKRKINKV